MIELLKQIPMSIITAVIALGAAVLASSITIVGVWLSNKHSRKLQKMALKHQAKERDLDRKLELRKDIYLKTAEHLTVAIQHLSTLNMVSFADEDPSKKLNPFVISANKALLVASDDSVDKINNLLTELTKVFLKLVDEAKPSQDILIERNIQKKNYHHYDSERSRILASMTQFNEDARVESQVWEALTRNLNFSSEQTEKASIRRSEADASLQVENLKYVKVAFEEIKVLTQLIQPVMVALRSEMEISSDLDHYKRSLEERFTEIEGLVMESLNGLAD